MDVLGVQQPQQQVDPRTLVDPRGLRLLVVDSKSSSRQALLGLLQECSYQVRGVATTREALDLVAAEAATGAGGWPAFDLIIKEHEPPAASALHLLRKSWQLEALRRIPIVVVSSQGDRDSVMECLNCGATDYLLKPLRRNELQTLWTRVWWRRVIHTWPPLLPVPAVFSPAGNPVLELRDHGYPVPSRPSNTSSGEGTKREEDEEPISKEGSAPGNGSGGSGSGGQDDNTRSRHQHAAADGNGNSATRKYSSSEDGKFGGSGSAEKASEPDHLGQLQGSNYGSNHGSNAPVFHHHHYNRGSNAGGGGNASGTPDTGTGHQSGSSGVRTTPPHHAMRSSGAAPGDSRGRVHSQPGGNYPPAMQSYNVPSDTAGQALPQLPPQQQQQQNRSPTSGSRMNAYGGAAAADGGSQDQLLARQVSGSQAEAGPGSQPSTGYAGGGRGPEARSMGQQHSSGRDQAGNLNSAASYGFRQWVNPGEMLRKRSAVEIADGSVAVERVAKKAASSGPYVEMPQTTAGMPSSAAAAVSEDTLLGAAQQLRASSALGRSPSLDSGPRQSGEPRSGGGGGRGPTPPAGWQIMQGQLLSQLAQAQSFLLSYRPPLTSPAMPLGPQQLMQMAAGMGQAGGGWPQAGMHPAAANPSTSFNSNPRQGQQDQQQALAQFYQQAFSNAYGLGSSSVSAPISVFSPSSWNAGGGSARPQPSTGSGKPAPPGQQRSAPAGPASRPPHMHPLHSALHQGSNTSVQQGMWRGMGGSGNGGSGVGGAGAALGGGGAAGRNSPAPTAEGGQEPTRSERRRAALQKYKQKREKLVFGKKIRYESRKQLAQTRPRVKGQFVKVLASGAGEPEGEGTSHTAAAAEWGPSAVEPAAEVAEPMAVSDEEVEEKEEELGDDEGQGGIVPEEDEEEDVVNSPQDMSAVLGGGGGVGARHSAHAVAHGPGPHAHAGAGAHAAAAVGGPPHQGHAAVIAPSHLHEAAHAAAAHTRDKSSGTGAQGSGSDDGNGNGSDGSNPGGKSSDRGSNSPDAGSSD